MSALSFPILVLTDKTRFEDLSALFTTTARELGARKAPNAILLYELADAPEWAHATVKPPSPPERMLVMAFQANGCAVIERALGNVAQRIPEKPAKSQAKLTAKGNTPLRNFFHQLEDLALTRFRLNHASAPGTGLFFLRTPEVLAAFKQELPGAVAAVAATLEAASKPAS
ncbi:MAG TPA: hypothetical protein VHD62_10745 [Opitutaceae bacterium]|nr:hypothetical protein [Opitutaceae bacterium]